MTEIKKVTFNDGFLDVYFRFDSDEDDNIERKYISRNIPYGIDTVTENRFNAALYDGTRLDKVVHIPFYKELPSNAYVEIEGKEFSIWKQQPIRTTNPPINVLSLKVYE